MLQIRAANSSSRIFNWPTSAAVYLPGNKVPKPAELFRNPAAGSTYLRIIKEAEAGEA